MDPRGAGPRARRGARAPSGAFRGDPQTGPPAALTCPQLSDLAVITPGRAGHRGIRDMVLYRLRSRRPPRKSPAADRRTAVSAPDSRPAAPLGHLGPLIHCPVHRPPRSGSGVPPPPGPAAGPATAGSGPRPVRGQRAPEGSGPRHDADRSRFPAPAGPAKKQGIRPNRCEHGPEGPRTARVQAMSPFVLRAQPPRQGLLPGQHGG